MPEEEKPSLVNVKDLAGLSGPLTKLVETVGANIGRLYDGVGKLASTYLLASKDAKNEAERILFVEGAKTKVLEDRAKMVAALSSSRHQHFKTLDITGGDVSAQLTEIPAEIQSLHERSDNRVAYQNALHQLNLESVIANAAAGLSEEEEVNPEPVELDWTARFFNITQDISNEDMQFLWGKILAGEVKKPGSFSLRTLDVLRNLSQYEASTFNEACNFIVSTRTQPFFYRRRGNKSDDILDKYLAYNKISTLVDSGLVQGTEQDAVHFGSPASTDTNHRINLRIGQYLLRCTKSAETALHLEIAKYTLTQAAVELSHLLNPIVPIAYLIDIASDFKDEGFDAHYCLFNGWDLKEEYYPIPLMEIPSK